MKVIHGLFALFVGTALASSAVAQSSTPYQIPSNSTSSQATSPYFQASSTKLVQDEDPRADDDDLLLDQEAISEQLKQLKKENDEIKEMLKGYEEKFEAFEGFEEGLEEQSSLIEEIDDSLSEYVITGHGAPQMTLFGRVHADYWAFPKVENSLFPLEPGNPQDRYNFRRVRIGVKGDIRDNMFYKIQMEFAEGNNPSYRDVYLGIKDLPLLQRVTVGNHKRPYGLDHWNSSNHNVFIERPVIIEAFNQDSRRMGISSWGHNEDLTRSWQYGVFHHRLTQQMSGYIGDHYQPEFASRMAFTPWWDECSGGRGYAHFAVSTAIAFPDGRGGLDNDARYRSRPEARTNGRWWNTGRILNANKSSLVGVEGVFNAGPFQIVSEYQYMTVDRNGFANSVQLHGGYVYASYFLTGEHMEWDRKVGKLGRVVPHENFWRVRDCNCMTQTGLGAWQVALRLSHADLTDEDIIGGDGTAVTFGLNWYWNPRARWQFNYIVGDLKRDPIGSGNYEIFGTRFMVYF